MQTQQTWHGQWQARQALLAALQVPLLLLL
jgi:hypothetical protein